MRDLFNQDRAMSPALIRLGVRMLGLSLGTAGALFALMGLYNILFNQNLFTGLFQMASGIGGFLALYLIVRLLAEAVMALHRLNDRMTVLAADMAAATQPKPDAPEPAPKPKPVKRTRAATKPKPAAKAAPAKEAAEADADAATPPSEA